MNTYIPAFVPANKDMVIIAPKGLLNYQEELIKDDESIIFYFYDGCGYSILIEKDEWEENECVAYYGADTSAAKCKTFNKPTYEENKKWAINWASKVAKDVLEKGYN